VGGRGNIDQLLCRRIAINQSIASLTPPSGHTPKGASDRERYFSRRGLFLLFRHWYDSPSSSRLGEDRKHQLDGESVGQYLLAPNNDSSEKTRYSMEQNRAWHSRIYIISNLLWLVKLEYWNRKMWKFFLFLPIYPIYGKKIFIALISRFIMEKRAQHIHE